MKVLIPAVLLLLAPNNAGAQSAPAKNLPKFLGRNITIVEPERVDEFFPKGPASVCIEGPPQRQCYTAPEAFGNSPKVEVVQLTKDMAALLFSAESGGVSGWQIHFALLRPGTGKDLENLFPFSLSVSNQSQHEFWTDANISDEPIFITAQYVWGPDEGHYDEHRYIVSAYTWRSNSGDLSYYLEDQYMTVRKYDLDANDNILASEKQDILARLARVKAETEREKRTPR